ncbi:hypothetical protein JVT61DRAFT_6193 [Boletus reticuloceps]|uniref:Uncharacterized protein n=1 Tax=Boletus reticuloceps TaxID=495285 RepID=A0A8I3A8K2_9AGAM|nr:hypothetical protein JVT61DRAFT_6193 [Boletus reticuloceps]
MKASKHPLPATSEENGEVPSVPKRQKVKKRIVDDDDEMGGKAVEDDSVQLPQPAQDDDVILQPISTDLVEEHPAPAAQEAPQQPLPYPPLKSSQVPAHPPSRFSIQAWAHSRAPSQPPAMPTQARACSCPPRPRAGSVVPSNHWGNTHGQFYPMPIYPNAGGMPQFFPPSYPSMMNAYPYGVTGGLGAGPSRLQGPAAYYLEDVEEEWSDS